MGLLLPTLFDLLYWVVWFVVYATAGAAGLATADALWAPEPWRQGVAIAAGYAVFLHAFVLVLCLLKRVLQPKLRGSNDRVGSNRSFIAWGLSSVFQGVFISSFVHDQVHFLFWLRFAYYRLMGMRLHPGVLLGTGAVLRQVELIEIGRGSVVGIGATISCHINRDGDSHLQAPVRIGAGALIGSMAAVGPGCVIGDGCVLGSRTTLPNDVTVGDGARLGSLVVAKGGVTIGEGARVLSSSLVLCDVPAGETWAGNPAVRIKPQPSAPKLASASTEPAAPTEMSTS